MADLSHLKTFFRNQKHNLTYKQSDLELFKIYLNFEQSNFFPGSKKLEFSSSAFKYNINNGNGNEISKLLHKQDPKSPLKI